MTSKLKFLVLTTLVLILSVLTSSLQFLKKEKEAISFSQAETEFILKELSSDKMEGRKSGTKGFNLACDFIDSFFTANKIAPFFNNSFKDTVSVEGRTSFNMVGVIGKNNPKQGYIVLGAHLDHLGKFQSSKDSVYNG